MDALSALRLQLEWGADEALADQPLDRFAARAPGAAATATAERPPSRGQRSRTAAGDAPQPAAAAPPRPNGRRTWRRGAHLAELREALARFDGCALSTTATNLVFADGDPNSGLMFVGEGPGAEEDRAGLPFVGPSGQLLDRMLASIGLDRSGYLITNLIPWRPPGNRNPTDSEVLDLLAVPSAPYRAGAAPSISCCLARWPPGRCSAEHGYHETARQMDRGDYPRPVQPLPTLPMLHPAYLLRNPGAKRDAWADLRLLRRTLDMT